MIMERYRKDFTVNEIMAISDCIVNARDRLEMIKKDFTKPPMSEFIRMTDSDGQGFSQIPVEMDRLLDLFDKITNYTREDD